MEYEKLVDELKFHPNVGEFLRKIGYSAEYTESKCVDIADILKKYLSDKEVRHQEVLEEIATKIDRLGRKAVEHFSPTRSISQGIVESLSDAASIVRSYKK